MLNQLRTSIFILGCSLLLLIAPAAAQPVIPPPSSNASLVDDLSDAVETNGIVAAVLFGTVVVLGLIVTAVVIVAYKGLEPLIKSNTKAHEQAAELTNAFIEQQRQFSLKEDRINETRQLQAEALRKTAESQAEQVRIMQSLETRDEAGRNRTSAVETINKHTTDTVDVVNTAINQIDKDLKDIRLDLEAKVTRDDFHNGIRPVVDKLDSISREVAELKLILAAKSEHTPPFVTTDDAP